MLSVLSVIMNSAFGCTVKTPLSGVQSVGVSLLCEVID